MHVPRPSFDQCVLAAAVVVHLFTAWSSTGFHVADEHYQVIAFAEAKLGHQPLEDLPWEYAERLRGTLLPVLCMAVFSLADGVGIGDPFLLAFFLRLLTAMVALWAMWRSAQCARHHLPAWCWRPFLLLSFFLWFLPFLQVRFTGETWSGIFLLMAMAPMLGAGTGNLPTYRIGLLLGLAFLCRPPTLAAAVGMVAWLVLVQRAPARRLFQLAVGFVAVWLLGIALDSWYYGQPTLTAWNYLHRGILGRSGSPFVAYPWWYYFPWVFKQALPLVGAAILLAFALLVAWRPRHLLTWTLVPFLLLHLAVPHKELRMLYPVAGLMPPAAGSGHVDHSNALAHSLGTAAPGRVAARSGLPGGSQRPDRPVGGGHQSGRHRGCSSGRSHPPPLRRRSGTNHLPGRSCPGLAHPDPGILSS